MPSDSFDGKPCPHGYTHCVPCSELRSSIRAAFPLDKEWLRPTVRFPQRNHIVYAVSLDLPLATSSWQFREQVEADPQHTRDAWLECLQDLYQDLTKVQQTLLNGTQILHRNPTPARTAWTQLAGKGGRT